jgi:hypothetical protein
VDLPDRGGRRKHDGDAESNSKCHKDEFRAHHAASHFHLHPADIWAAGVAIQTRAECCQRTGSQILPRCSPRSLPGSCLSEEENARFHLNECDTLSSMRRFTARNPFKLFLNWIGTGATGPSCSARAESRGVPIHMAANLLLDLAFF